MHIQGKYWSFPGASLFTRITLLQVLPLLVDFISQMSLSLGPLLLSAKHIYTVPLYREFEISQAVIGKWVFPYQPPTCSVTTVSLLSHVSPPSVDLLKAIPNGPDQDVYISPFGPVQGTAPSTVKLESTQFPACLQIRIGVLKLAPLFVERQK